MGKERMKMENRRTDRQKKEAGRIEERVRAAQALIWCVAVAVCLLAAGKLEVRAAEVAGGLEVRAAEARPGEDSVYGHPVEETIVCERIEGAAVIPDVTEGEIQIGEEKMTVPCYLREKRVIREYWEDDFSFPVIFRSYGAGLYELGGQLIPVEEESPVKEESLVEQEGGPLLEGYEESLLQEIGVSSEEYRIREVRWDGDPYPGKDGVMERRALASGERLLRDYELRYVGTAWFPEAPPATVAAETEEAPPVEPLVRVEPEPEREEVLPPAPPAREKSGLTRIWRITRTVLVTVGIGTLLFFGGMLLLLLVRSRKKSANVV